MTKDIEQELDAIFAHHNARVAQTRNETAGKVATGESFTRAAAQCFATVITPALQQMAHALNARGVAAKVVSGESETRINIPVSKLTRLGHGFGGYPYLRARSDRQTQRIHFERNTSDAHGGNAVGDYATAEINPELVKAMVVDLVRALYGPF